MRTAYTRLDAKFTQPYSSGATTVNVGNRLPGVPSSSLFSDLTWRHVPSGFHAALEGRFNSRISVNDLNSESAPAYSVWNIRAGFEQRSGSWRFSEFVRIDNFTNRSYIGSVIVAESNGRYYEPAPGRNAIVGVLARLGFN